MTSKELRKLEADAVRKRKSLAALERAFARWRAAKKTARLAPEARGLALDAWIRTLGDARWAHDRAVADLSEARRKRA